MYRHTPAFSSLPHYTSQNPRLKPPVPSTRLMTGLESAVTSNWKHFYCYLSDWIHTWLQICRVFLSRFSSRRSVLLHSLLIHSGCDDGTKTWANKRFRFESFWCWRKPIEDRRLKISCVTILLPYYTINPQVDRQSTMPGFVFLRRYLLIGRSFGRRTHRRKTD